jgi:flagellar export protein FliJ
LRAHHQARAREVFAAAVHLYVKAEAQLAEGQARRGVLERMMHDGRRASFRAADEVSFWDAYRKVCAEEVELERLMIEARAKMEKCREDYLEAHRAVKVIDRLEQKARTSYRQDSDREAQNELDELAGLRIARRLAASTVTSP